MERRKKVLIVEDNQTAGRILSGLLANHYDVVSAASVAEAMRVASTSQPDGAVVDLHLPDGSGIELIAELQHTRPDLRILALTAEATEDERLAALTEGATGVLMKGGPPDQILEGIREVMENRSVLDPAVARALVGDLRDLAASLGRTAGGTRPGSAELATSGQVRAFVEALEARCPHTAGHSSRIETNSVLVATRLGMAPNDIECVRLGAKLHDIGKVGIPDFILWKQESLTTEEWDAMRTHPLVGSHMIERSGFPSGVAEIVLHHHEQFDGSGYPRGLKGEAIPLSARIVAVVDAYDAMRSARPYRDPMPRDTALVRLRKGAGAQFDPGVVHAFGDLSVDEPPEDTRVEKPLWQQIAAANK